MPCAALSCIRELAPNFKLPPDYGLGAGCTSGSDKIKKDKIRRDKLISDKLI